MDFAESAILLSDVVDKREIYRKACVLEEKVIQKFGKDNYMTEMMNIVIGSLKKELDNAVKEYKKAAERIGQKKEMTEYILKEFEVE